MWSESCQMLEEYYSSAKEVKITDYDTVIFPGMKEITMDKFFDFLEKKIKKYEVTECNFIIDSNIVIFKYNNSYYKVKLKDTNSGMGVILLNLVKLEEKLRKEKEYNTMMLEKKERELRKDREYENVLLDRRKKLLEEARNGNILSEEAKQLYIQELKNSIGFRGILKKLKNIRDNSLRMAMITKYSDENILFALSCCLLILGTLFSLAFGSIVLGLSLGVILILQINSVLTYDTGIFMRIIYFVYELSKNKLFEEIKTIKHKIKYLEKCKFENKEDVFSNIENNIFDENINIIISRIYDKLLQLDEKERKQRGIILTYKIDSIKQTFLDISKLQLEIEKEVFLSHLEEFKNDINEGFLTFLEMFEEDIDKLLGVIKNEGKNYAFKGESRGEVLTSDGTKKRVLE